MNPVVYAECLELISERDNLPASALYPVTLPEVMAIEEELGASLPDHYEEFVLEAGVGAELGGLAEWFHLELTRPGNLIEANRDLAREQAASIRKQGAGVSYPTDFLAVYDPREGEVFGFLRGDGDYEPAVYQWDLEEFRLERVADDLYSFLDELVDCDEDEVALIERRAEEP